MTPIPNLQSPIPVSRASVHAWLLSRQPPPPAALAAKLGEIVDAVPDDAFTRDSMAAVMGAIGVFALRAQPSTADQAMHLLAADALVTYSFEAAAEEGGDVAALAHELLTAVRA